MRVLLVNASAPTYNLGLEKARGWWRTQGVEPDWAGSVPPPMLCDYDAVWISAIFSWHVPALLDGVRIAQFRRATVEVGGPGTFGVRDLIQRETGGRQWPG